MGHRGAQYIRYLDIVIYVTSDVISLKIFFFCYAKEALRFTVQAMSHQFKRDIGIATHSWRLTLVGEEGEDLFHVCHVEVATNSEILCTPVVATQEWMHILQAALSCCGIAEVAHQ